MNEKENKQLVNKPSEAIEDLTVNEAEAEDVKGGAFNAFANFGDIKGESDNSPNPDVRPVYNPYITVDYVEHTRK